MKYKLVNCSTNVELIHAIPYIIDAINVAYNSPPSTSCLGFCDIWHIAALTHTRTACADIVIYLYDESSEKGALGWHEAGKTSDAVAYIDVGTILSHGGGITGPKKRGFSVSSVIAHELLEAAINTNANGWEMMTDERTLLAREVCDPVQNDYFAITTRLSATWPRQIHLSNAVTPAYFYRDTAGRPFDLIGNLKTAFGMTPGGYQIQYDLETRSYKSVWEESTPFAARVCKECGRTEKKGWISKITASVK